MTSITEKLQETLKDLNDAELNHFKWILQKTVRQRGLPRILSSRMERADRADVVDLMVAMYSEQSVDMIREVFRKMNRTDLEQKLPEISSASKGKLCEEQISIIWSIESTITSDRERIQKMLQDLNESEFKEFKWTLKDRNFMSGLPYIQNCKLDKADMLDLVDLMIHAYSQRSVEVTKKIFKKMNRNDLELFNNPIKPRVMEEKYFIHSN
uniref:Pyrin domain-containing protein n=1 Tax=Acanthochromis polyacanthus TaxID=80966 RepID=A0A3Q1F3W5_9TELE